MSFNYDTQDTDIQLSSGRGRVSDKEKFVNFILSNIHRFDPKIKYYFLKCIGPSTFHYKVLAKSKPYLNFNNIQNLIDHQISEVNSKDQKSIKSLFNQFISRENQLCKDHFVLYSSWRPDLKFYYDCLRMFRTILKMRSFSTRTMQVRPEGIENVDTFLKMMNTKFPRGHKLLRHRADLDNPESWRDWEQDFKKYAMSTNLFLFGNFGIPGENTVTYFLQKVSHVQRDGVLNLIKTNILEPLLDMPPDAIDLIFDGIKQIYNKYLAKQTYGIINQIFINKNTINQLVYLSKYWGLPYPNDVPIDQFLDGLEQGGVKYVEKYMTRMYHKYKDIKIWRKTFSLPQNDPLKKQEKIYNFINELQARLIYNENMFEDPSKVLLFEGFIQDFDDRAYHAELLKYFGDIVSGCLEEPHLCKLKNFRSSEVYRQLKMFNDTCTIC